MRRKRAWVTSIDIGIDVEGGVALGAGAGFHVVVHQVPVTIEGAGFYVCGGQGDEGVLIFACGLVILGEARREGLDFVLELVLDGGYFVQATTLGTVDHG